MKDKNYHEGRRQRIRSKYANHGLDCFAEHEVLELLLTYAIPRRDTNVLAHQLIEEAGGFCNVFDSDKHVFDKVSGAGENARLFIKLINDIRILYNTKKLEVDKKPLKTAKERGNYCKALLAGNKVETLNLICFSPGFKVLSTTKLAEGDINNVPIYIKQILAKALEVRAASVMLAHNHPGGEPVPSEDDVRATFEVIAALRAVDIAFCDHVIVGDGGDWVSMKESGIV